mgnify:CR=1 FL=1
MQSVVGGSKATIYAWFGGKEGLFEAVVRQKCDDVTLHIDTEIRGTLEDQLTRIGHSFLDTVLTPPIDAEALTKQVPEEMVITVPAPKVARMVCTAK